MSELINRPEYLEQLIQNRDVDLIKIVTGIRRCGKSSLLDLYHRYLTDHGVADSNIIHMNLESLRYRGLTDYLSFYDYVSERIPKDGKTYLIFDELQVIEHWEKAVESSCQEQPVKSRKNGVAASAEVMCDSPVPIGLLFIIPFFQFPFLSFLSFFLSFSPFSAYLSVS